MEGIQVVAFGLGEEEYAVDINMIKEIIRPTKMTRVPRTQDYIVGVINLRGVVVPVICLHRRFGLLGKEMDDDTRIIILNIEGINIGVRVDRVTEVLWLEQENIEDIETLDSADSEESDYITGIGKLDNRLIILLDLEKTLGIAEE